MNDTTCTVLASEVDKVETAWYNKILAQVSAPHEIFRVRDNTPTILMDGIANKISIYRTYKVPGLQGEPGTNGDTHHTIYFSQPQGNETDNNDNDHSVFDKVVHHVTKKMLHELCRAKVRISSLRAYRRTHTSFATAFCEQLLERDQPP